MRSRKGINWPPPSKVRRQKHPDYTIRVYEDLNGPPRDLPWSHAHKGRNLAVLEHLGKKYPLVQLLSPRGKVLARSPEDSE
jgi:hypothetical protein